MSTTNQTGKSKISCSCGVKAALNSHEIQKWTIDHAVAVPGVEHKVTVDPKPIGVGEIW